MAPTGFYATLGFDAEAEGFRRYLREVPTAVREARDRISALGKP